MPFYKFLSAEHVPAVLSGSLKFGSLEHYRRLEAEKGDEWIGDRNEGVSITDIDDVFVPPGPEGDEMRRRFAQAGFAGDTRGSTSWNVGCVSSVQIDAYVFSFCVGELNALKEVMLGDGYDACIEISDPRLFGEAIRDASVVETIEGHPRFGKIFSWITVASVEYGSNRTNIRLAEPRRPTSFLKNERYAPQCEARVVAFPRHPLAHRSLTLRVEGLADILRPVCLG